MYAIVRGDLQMPAGKLSAQAGHAYTDCLFEAYRTNPDLVSIYRNPSTGGSKVTLKAKNLNKLLAAYNEAIQSGIPCAAIVDQAHILPPHFDGSPIITAIGLGPCTKAQCEHITRKFNCV